jgi:hypothetical protein
MKGLLRATDGDSQPRRRADTYASAWAGLYQELLGEAVGEPVAVAAACPAAHASEQLVQFWARKRPYGLDGFVVWKLERPVGGEGIDEHAEVVSRSAWSRARSSASSGSDRAAPETSATAELRARAAGRCPPRIAAAARAGRSRRRSGEGPPPRGRAPGIAADATANKPIAGRTPGTSASPVTSRSTWTQLSPRSSLADDLAYQPLAGPASPGLPTAPPLSTSTRSDA